MSQGISITPPPPPPIPPTNSVHTSAGTNASVVKLQLANNEYSWALDHPEVQKGCFLSRVCQHAPPKECQYYNIASILQNGPTCGLTALSMLLNGQPTAGELLTEAVKQHYTINGEMFSAQYLYELSQKYLACELYDDTLNCANIKDRLCAGCCLLVPYDADVNHAPCQKSGHRAHWALIVGYLIDDQDEFHVLARHGKTRNLAVWSLSALSESNANLVEFAQPKGYPDCTFLLPPGGINGPLGLNERAILVNGLSQEIVKVV
ncbi:actin maturation protease [Drosophila nasuta]|uniref:actin maturation protease n=1 Tax=Drosophila nasuta TaxID=42062 RepID=UPI00295EBF87|nr:actin maturation protease [Drosophila nasuta]